MTAAQCITRSKFLAATEGVRYWGGAKRWDYYLGQVVELIRARGCDGSDVLEIGPMNVPLVLDSMRMDIEPACQCCVGHDAGEAPWPFVNGSFDIVVACQVWEHLGEHSGGRQAIAFQEARRVSRALLITVPWKWYKGDLMHQGINEAIVDGWSGGLPATIFRLVPNSRALFLWEFAE